jgi:hypothetical protein
MVMSSPSTLKTPSAIFFTPFQEATTRQGGYRLVNARLQFDSADGER